jgi:hypothetical protein
MHLDAHEPRRKRRHEWAWTETQWQPFEASPERVELRPLASLPHEPLEPTNPSFVDVRDQGKAFEFRKASLRQAAYNRVLVQLDHDDLRVRLLQGREFVRD